MVQMAGARLPGLRGRRPCEADTPGACRPPGGERVHVQVATHTDGIKVAAQAVTDAGGEVTKSSPDGTLLQGWLPQVTGYSPLLQGEERAPGNWRLPSGQNGAVT